MTFPPIKFGTPVNDLLMLNYLFNKKWKLLGEPAATTFEKRFARMWHHDAVVLVGNALGRSVIGSDDVGRYPYHRYWFQSAAAINNSFENYFNLDAGTYDFVVLCRTGTAAGIVSWSVDSVSIGTMDLYANPGSEYALKTITGVTISTDGIHTLTGTVASKNASATNYAAYLYKYHFREQ
jgi:hypothetical protein